MNVSPANDKPYIVIPILQVRPSGLISYPSYEWLRPRPKRLSLNQQLMMMGVKDSGNINEVRKEAYSGKMSPGSIKRMKRSIQLLIASAIWKTAYHPDTNKEFRFRVNFITLTLPSYQGTRSDSDIRKYCLEPFIRKLRDKFGMKSYIWKAERQVNGNLHFHITTDIFINYHSLRDIWNQQLAKLGFIEEFFVKHGHRKPNSTDVHAVWDVDNLPGYLIKYMTKAGDEVDRIEGKVWDCSLNLKTKIRCEFEIDESESKYWQIMEDSFIDRVFKKDFVTMIPLNENELNSTLPDHMFLKYSKYLDAIRTGEIINWKKDSTYSLLANYQHKPRTKPKPNAKTYYYITNRKVRKAQYLAATNQNSNNLNFTSNDKSSQNPNQTETRIDWDRLPGGKRYTGLIFESGSDTK